MVLVAQRKTKTTKRVAKKTTRTTQVNPGKTLIGISRDHSGSMRGITGQAAKDYNNNISTMQQESVKSKSDTFVSVVECGTGRTDKVGVEITNSPVHYLNPINNYIANGWGTPLFDSVGELIEILEKSPDAKKKDTAFLVMAITDGQENASTKWKNTLAPKIQELQATDRWTFVFRVPHGYKNQLTRLGIPEGNILEWEQTTAGFEKATQVTSSSLGRYYGSRGLGATSSQSFFTNITSGDTQKIKNQMMNISHEVKFMSVNIKSEIKPFCEQNTGQPYVIGRAFYQLMKREHIQDHKQIMIRNKKSQETYAGVEARNILGFPQFGEIKVHPGNHGNWDIFVQSTSVNRHLLPGTAVIYWNRAT